MKKILFVSSIVVLGLVILGGIIASWSWRVRINDALAGEPCPSATPRTYPAGSYTGPLWDTHVHIPAVPAIPAVVPKNYMKKKTGSVPSLGINTSIPSMACTFAAEGTDKIFGFFSVYDLFARPMVEVARRSKEAYPDLFVPFIMPPDRDNNPGGSPTVDADTLEDMLSVAPGLFDGYGEIGLYAREGGAAELLPDDPKMLEIYPLASANALAVYVHLGRGHQDNLERAAELFPNINFIFHGDQLIAYGENKRQDLSVIDGMLDRHPNIFYGVDELYGDEWLLHPSIDKEAFMAHFRDPEPLLEYDVRTWKAFIERHPNQVLWGTDRGWSSDWSLNADVGLQLTGYTRTFIGRLNPAVQENYAYKNAQRLIDGASR